MFKYFLLHYLQKHQKFIKRLEWVYFSFLGTVAFIVVFGNLVLAVYTERNAALHTQIIHNLPFVVKILLIHSWWIGVALLVLTILSGIFTPPFARVKNHHIGEILMEVKFQRWKNLIKIILAIPFGFFVFLGFGVVIQMYAFGLFILLLLCCWLALLPILRKSLALTENGVWVKRTFFDVFIPYNELMPLSDEDIQEALQNERIDINVGGSSVVICYQNSCKVCNHTRESFMNLYNEKVREFRQNYTKDSNAN